MSESKPPDPMPVIRGVFAVGFLASNLVAFLCIALSPRAEKLLPALWDLQAIAVWLLCAAAAALGIGLLGMACGGTCGLASKLAMEKLDPRRRPAIRSPIFVSAVISAAVGLAAGSLLSQL